MEIQPVILWTDGLLFLLCFFALIAIIYAFFNPYLKRIWREVFRSKMGMAAFIVLMVYVTTGLLDSFHFRTQLPNIENQTEKHYSIEVTSVLDLIIAPQCQEKTYSAPFSAFQFSKENIERADGTLERQYPRLKCGGNHLNEATNDQVSDILWRTMLAIVWALLIWVGLAWLLVLWLDRKNQWSTWRKIWTGNTEIPWKTALITIGILILLISWFAQMANGYHIFGTDKAGADIFYQAIKSVRTGLIVGTVTILIMLPLAISLGIMAGYFGGWVDDIIQYLYTTLSAIPTVLLIAASMLILGLYIENNPDLFPTAAQRGDMRLLFLCIIMGMTNWIALCRLLRAESLKLRELGYVQAAQVFFVPKIKIITKHLLPNMMHIVLITIVLEFSFLVLAEVVLSYLGIGVDPTTSSWGNMINAARLELAREPVVWWTLTAAFLFMFGLVLAANIFSDVVSRAFDPRNRYYEKT